MNKSQDEIILAWLSRSICGYLSRDSRDFEFCGFCEKNSVALRQAFEYGKDGRLPLSLAEVLMRGSQ